LEKAKIDRLNIKEQLLGKNHALRPGGKYKKTSVTIHSTANPSSTAQNERDWLDNPSNARQAAWHYVAGEDIAICAIPDEEEAWHCGVQKGNRESISIELTESGDRKKVLETGAALTAILLDRHSLGISDITTHMAHSGKNCPRILFDKNYIKDGMDWDYFIKRVENYMEKRYNSLSELPEWAVEAVRTLLDAGFLSGNETGLDLSEDMLRLIVINYRAGLYTKA